MQTSPSVEFTSFNDLKVAYGTPYEKFAVRYWANAILAGDIHAAKCAKREDRRLQEALGLNEAGLRKLLVSIRREHPVKAKKK